MWIRSQDKESLGDYTRFEIVPRSEKIGEDCPEDLKKEIREKYNIEDDTIKTEWLITGGTPYQDYGHILGAYSYKEQALKVLDMIQEAVQGIKKTEYDYKDDKKIINHYYFENKRQIVFQMPKNEEV